MVQRLFREVRMSPYSPLWMNEVRIHSSTIDVVVSYIQRQRGVKKTKQCWWKEINLGGLYSYANKELKSCDPSCLICWNQPEWEVCLCGRVRMVFYLTEEQPAAPLYWTCSFTSSVIFVWRRRRSSSVISLCRADLSRVCVWLFNTCMSFFPPPTCFITPTNRRVCYLVQVI